MYCHKVVIPFKCDNGFLVDTIVKAGHILDCSELFKLEEEGMS